MKKINLKELFCWHEWEYLENPDWNSKCVGKVKCVKCEKEDERYVKPERVHRRLYMWCDKCGNEINNKRNHIQHLENYYDNCNINGDINNINSGVYLYECLQCGKIHIFDFNIGPGPISIKLTDKIPVLTQHEDHEKYYELVNIEDCVKFKDGDDEKFEGAFIENPKDLTNCKPINLPFKSNIDLDELLGENKYPDITDHYGIIESMKNLLKLKEESEEELIMKKFIDEILNDCECTTKPLLGKNEITETDLLNLTKELRSKGLLNHADIDIHPIDIKRISLLDNPIFGKIKLHDTK